MEKRRIVCISQSLPGVLLPGCLSFWLRMNAWTHTCFDSECNVAFIFVANSLHHGQRDSASLLVPCTAYVWEASSVALQELGGREQD